MTQFDAKADVAKLVPVFANSLFACLYLRTCHCCQRNRAGNDVLSVRLNCRYSYIGPVDLVAFDSTQGAFTVDPVFPILSTPSLTRTHITVNAIMPEHDHYLQLIVITQSERDYKFTEFVSNLDSFGSNLACSNLQIWRTWHVWMGSF